MKNHNNKYIINLSIFVVITVLLFDYLFGKLFLESDETIYRIRDNIFHHTLKKSFSSKKAKSVNGFYEINTDVNGFKSSKENLNRTSKNFDIFFLGDSQAEGVGFKHEDTYVGIIEKKFPKLNIANLSVSSYSSQIYLAKLKYYFENNFKVDNVYIHYDLSDLWDDYFLYEYSDGKASSKNKSNRIDLILYFFVKNFPLTYKIYHFLKNFDKENDIVVNPYHIPAGKYFYQNEDEFFSKDERIIAYKKSFDLLYKISNLCKKNNAKLNIIISPWPSSIKNYDKKNLFEKNFINFCKQNCFKLINLFPFFINEAEKSNYDEVSKKYFFMEFNDQHFNKNGHEIMAELISKEIKIN